MNKSIVSIVKNPTAPDAARIAEMVEETMNQLGGMEKFVKKGDYVVVKGNFFAPYPPPVIVDRRVVSAFIKLIFRAGASRVVLCEAVSIGTKLGRGTGTSWIMEEMGITEAAVEAGAEVLCLEDDERVRVKVPNARSIGEVDYPKCMYECDVLISLPCMKMHSMTLVTLGIKNFHGILSDVQKYYAHRDDLEQKLVDLQKIRKTDLTFIDGLLAMEGNGSGESGLPHPMNMLIASADIVAADAVASACMGIEDVLDVTSIRLAQHDRIGNADLDKIEVIGPRIDDVKEDFLLPDAFQKQQDRYLTGMYDNVNVYIGGACKQCWFLGSMVARALSRFKDKEFSLFLGIDPKFPGELRTDLDGVVIFGDCACSSTGAMKDIRNRMLLEKKGLIAPGCPPFRPANSMLEEYLIERNMVKREMLSAGHQKAVKNFYAYYKAVDPTWVPKSEQ